jgi:hypothetical protein
MKTAEFLDGLLDVREAGKELGVSPAGVRMLMYRRRLAYVKVNFHVWIRRSEIERLRAERERVVEVPAVR